MRRRAQFSEFLSSNTTLTINRYFRLMALATVELMMNTPITAYGLYLNAIRTDIYPWKSWADIHFDWYTIDTFPAIFWRSNSLQVVALELSRWSPVICAFTFFAFFGFADESRKHYRLAYWAIAKRFGVSPPSPPSKSSSVFSFVFLLDGLANPSSPYQIKRLHSSQAHYRLANPHLPSTPITTRAPRLLRCFCCAQ
ncbi:hypothetical protein H0H81_002851 [Sphagnurus paluster]|uniref:Uncharacterized protein n=1 Tax=Sphagnurus paluster TaxID=117069 RepID=A0A9P7GME2_9AGAR|nr:hypothetical protein H0H81_002851 [Sphagnurus paluster]